MSSCVRILCSKSISNEAEREESEGKRERERERISRVIEKKNKI